MSCHLTLRVMSKNMPVETKLPFWRSKKRLKNSFLLSWWMASFSTSTLFLISSSPASTYINAGNLLLNKLSDKKGLMLTQKQHNSPSNDECQTQSARVLALLWEQTHEEGLQWYPKIYVCKVQIKWFCTLWSTEFVIHYRLESFKSECHFREHWSGHLLVT